MSDDSTSTTNADQRAAILETAGLREAATLETAGLRDAATLETAGIRDAATLQAGGERDAATLQAAGLREETVLMTAGQRATSLLWENTQAKIALIVVAAALLACLTIILSVVYLVFVGELDSVAIAVLTLVLGVMSNALFLVVGFYFGRTDHTKVGGVGARTEDER